MVKSIRRIFLLRKSCMHNCLLYNDEKTSKDCLRAGIEEIDLFLRLLGKVESLDVKEPYEILSASMLSRRDMIKRTSRKNRDMANRLNECDFIIACIEAGISRAQNGSWALEKEEDTGIAGSLKEYMPSRRSFIEFKDQIKSDISYLLSKNEA